MVILTAKELPPWQASNSRDLAYGAGSGGPNGTISDRQFTLSETRMKRREREQRLADHVGTPRVMYRGALRWSAHLPGSIG